MDSEEIKIYPCRNQPIVTLYQGNIGESIQKLNDRTFVAYLIENYEQNYGFKLPKITEIEWKYAMESLARAVDKAEINRECGMRIDCCRLTGLEFLTVVFASSDHDGRADISAVQLLSWEGIRYEKDGGVTYCDYDSDVQLRTAHPSNIAMLYARVAFRDVADDPAFLIKTCVFMYDASLKESTDIISMCPGEFLEAAPVFYSNDIMKIGSYISDTVRGGNGKAVFESISDRHEENSADDGDIEDSDLIGAIRKALEESRYHVAWLDEVMEKTGEDIDQFIDNLRDARNNTNSYNTFEMFAKQSLGISAWDKMEEDSQNWLVSALLSFNEMKNTDPLMDFSGVTLMVSKVYENELTRRYGDQYVAYLEKKYGDRFIDELPEELIHYRHNGEKEVIYTSKLTLGSIPFIMGMDASGEVKDPHNYNNFKAFCKDELMEDGTDIDKALKEICGIVYYVRVNFRNKSAHKEVVDIVEATDCLEYSITVQKKLRVLMDMFRETTGE